MRRQRADLERTHSLTRGELREGTTWGYYVTDLSSANLRDLVESPAVEDTHNIHRTAFRIWRTAPRGDYLGTRPAWIASILELLIPACLGLGGHHARRRRRSGPGADGACRRPPAVS